MFIFALFNQNLIIMKTSGFLAALLLISIFVVSCKKDPSGLIVGEWKAADIAYSQEISPDIKQKLKETLDEMKASSLWVINADGTFTKTILEESSIGKWVLSPDAKKLTLTYEDGNSEVSDVVELTNSKLVVSIEINDSKNTITWEKQANKKK